MTVSQRKINDALQSDQLFPLAGDRDKITKVAAIPWRDRFRENWQAVERRMGRYADNFFDSVPGILFVMVEAVFPLFFGFVLGAIDGPGNPTYHPYAMHYQFIFPLFDVGHFVGTTFNRVCTWVFMR